MAVPLGVTLIAAVFALVGFLAIVAGLYLFTIASMGSTYALLLAAPLTTLIPALKPTLERVSLNLSSADSGPFFALIMTLVAFGLATALFSVASGLTNLKPWSRTLVIVFTVIGIANGLARLADRTAVGSVPGVIAVGLSLVMLLYLCSPGTVALFEEGGE